MSSVTGTANSESAGPRSSSSPVPRETTTGQPMESASQPDKRPPLRTVARRLLPLGKRLLLRRTACTGLYRLFDHRAMVEPTPAAMSEARPDIPASYYYDPATTDWGMSRLTRGLLQYVDPEAISERRRHNYLRLFSQIQGLPGIQPVFGDLPSGVCPIGLPVLVDDRAVWARRLSDRHIDVYAWWSGYHSGIDWNQFPEACHLKDRILLLPIHQQLDDRHVDYIGREVAALAQSKVAHRSVTPEPPPREVNPAHTA